MLGDLLQLVLSGAGYTSLYKDLQDSREDISDTIGGLQDTVNQQGTFNPYTIKSRMGTSRLRDDGAIGMSLGDRAKGIQDQMWGQGQDMLGRAAADPAAREQEIYDRIRAMQAPEEQRQYESMNQNLFSRGRGGMGTTSYGGTPEQHAFGMAQAEARNQASLGAMEQTQSELMNQYRMGQGMLQEGYRPTDYLFQQAKLGQGYDQLGQTTDLNRLKMLTELGLGGLGTDVNYSNIQGNMIGNAMGMLGPLVGGLGDAAGNAIAGIPGLPPWLQDLLKIEEEEPS